MTNKTVVILTPTVLPKVNNIERFSTTVPIKRIIELIKAEESTLESEAKMKEG
jgi:hypothetical protein